MALSNKHSEAYLCTFLGMRQHTVEDDTISLGFMSLTHIGMDRVRTYWLPT